MNRIQEQILTAYWTISVEASYRPEPTFKGCAASWWREEEAQVYRIGCPDGRDRQTLIYIVEAARLLCAVDRERARKLLTLALKELGGQ